MVISTIGTIEIVIISVLILNFSFVLILELFGSNLSDSWLGRKINYLENRKEKKIKERPMPLKWETLKKEMADATEANNFKKQQQINSQIEWIYCLNNHLCNQEIKNIHLANDDYGALMSGSKDWKVEDKAQNRVYIKVKASDLIPPETFDIENTIHYSYCINIVGSIEGIVAKYELDENSIKKNGLKNLEVYLEDYLKYPKDQITRALTFLTSHQTKRTRNQGLNYGDYFEELKIKLDYFK